MTETMTETKHPGEKLTVTPAKATLTLKRPGVEQGMVKQSFSHGRTKAVVVEKVKSRRPDVRADAPPSTAPAAGAARKPQLTAVRGGAAPAAAPAPAGATPAGGVVLRKLNEDELTARASALESARVREAEERRVAEAEARRRNGR